MHCNMIGDLWDLPGASISLNLLPACAGGRAGSSRRWNDRVPLPMKSISIGAGQALI